MLSYDPSKPIAFMHVPKTSGTALAAALRKALRPRTAIEGFDRSTFGRFAAFETFDPKLQQSIYARTLPPAEFTTGHLAYSTLVSSRPDAQLVTLLREPRSRLLSHWLFWRTRTAKDLESWGAWADVVRRAQGSLASFIADPSLAHATDNLLVRMLLWPDPRIAGDAFIDPSDDDALAAAALHRLETFAFVDIVENDYFRANLQDWIGRRLSYPRANEMRHVPAAHRAPLERELLPEVIDVLEQRSRLDRVLWNAVAERILCHEPAAAIGARAFTRTGARYAAMMAVR